MRRSVRLVWHVVQLAVFLVLAYGAARFFVDAVLVDGFSPRTFLGLLLISGGVAMVWRAGLDLRRSVRRLRRS